MLSTKLWHLIGLLTAVGKLFLKKQLHEGLQLIVDVFALKLLHQVPLGKMQAPLPRAAGSLVVPVCSTENVF